MSRGIWGNGTIAPRGENAWRLRYRVGGQRYSVTFRGTRAEAGQSCGGCCATVIPACTFHRTA